MELLKGQIKGSEGLFQGSFRPRIFEIIYIKMKFFLSFTFVYDTILVAIVTEQMFCDYKLLTIKYYENFY